MYKLLIFLFFVASSLALNIGSKSLEPKQEVKLHDKYNLVWQIDRETQEIIFEVRVETHGFVGFGLNSLGNMDGADIVIGGFQNGEKYFSDRHGKGTTVPVVDENENWKLLDASEDETHTFLKFSRKWDTCDDQDFKINDDTLNIIWSFGLTDTIEQHTSDNRGTREYNFLDGAPPPVDISKFQKWEVRVHDEMPKQDTAYWCTMHRSPDFPKQQHLVGFNTYLENQEAVKHTHHFIAARCIAPENEDPDELFGPFVGTPGGDCELLGGNYTELKQKYCHEYLYIWAVGGEMMLFPEHVGFSIGHVTPTEYLLLEVHYDNPDEVEGVQYTTGFDVFYTDELRKNEAELLIMGHDVFPTQLLPANTSEFTIAGHCSPECTRAGLPEEGVHLFNYFFHAHLAGRRMKLHHYRDNKELPWLANDDRYNFNYQQTRNLRKEINLRPGDQLSLECVFDTTGRENATYAGLGTKEEMCQVFSWYYPKQPLKICSSAYEPMGRLYNEVLGLGIEDIDMSEHYFDPIITKPPQMAGKHVSQVLNENVQWTPQLVQKMQEVLHDEPHQSVGICTTEDARKGPINSRKGRVNLMSNKPTQDDEVIDWVSFPNIDEIYQPEDLYNRSPKIVTGFSILLFSCILANIF